MAAINHIKVFNKTLIISAYAYRSHLPYEQRRRVCNIELLVIKRNAFFCNVSSLWQSAPHSNSP